MEGNKSNNNNAISSNNNSNTIASNNNNNNNEINKRDRSDSSSSMSSSKKHIKTTSKKGYISLTSHPGRSGVQPIPVHWGSLDPATRGPIYCSTKEDGRRNAIGAHGGSYSIYRAISVASGVLDADYVPNYKNTEPAVKIGPFPSWGSKIVTIDCFGALVTKYFNDYLDNEKMDIRPTIAITKAHIDFPEVKEALSKGRLHPDGKILMEDGQSNVHKAAIEPVWYLPGVAARFGVTEAELRETLFRETNGMYPELMTRTDLKVFLPPIGGLTIYIWGDIDAITDPNKILAVRVHDECNGSDVFGSDICTCRPYLAHAIEVAIETAQKGGAGVIIYFRKEGRALGEVTKYLVYNARKRQEGGDTAAEYFNCTHNVAGVEDSRFQALMPDALHWLGITKIDKFVSMSNMKYDAIVASGIKIIERIPIPTDLIPRDANVEISAKLHAGYEGGNVHKVPEDLRTVIGKPA